MGYYSCCALVLSPKGEAAFQEATKKHVALLGKESTQEIFSLSKNLDRFYEHEGSTLRIWKWNKLYSDFPDVSFIESFMDDHWEDFRFLRLGEELGDQEYSGGYDDDPFQISINMDFDYKLKTCSPLFERHSNGMMVLKMVDISLLHIAPGDAKLLEIKANRHSVGCPVVYPKDHGYFVLVDDDDVYGEELRSAGFSDSFMTLFMMARATGAAWIDLDADGTDCPSLPKFQHT